MDPRQVRYLVFAGGGMRGLAYAGALAELADRGMDWLSPCRSLQGVAGASIGSLFAMCVAARMSTELMLLEVRRFTLQHIAQPNPCHLFDENGLDRGEKLQEYLRTLLLRLMGRRSMTLHEFWLSTKVRLVITVTNLQRGVPLYLDHQTAPDVDVIEALQLSMTLPLLFAPRRFRGELCVDGGLMDNFPTQLFPTEHTLALRCAWPREDDLDSFTQYVSRVVYCTLAQKESYPPHPHVISIDVCGVKTIELNLSQAQVEQLVNNGRLAASQTLLQLTPSRTPAVAVRVTPSAAALVTSVGHQLLSQLLPAAVARAEHPQHVAQESPMHVLRVHKVNQQHDGEQQQQQ